MALRGTSELHKFMPTERALKFLKDRTIRFTQPASLNDPYECHLTLDKKARELLKEKFSKGYKDHFKDISQFELLKRVEADEPSIIETALLEYRRRRDELGVLSLTENPLNLLMWAHYADEHRGLVIELDYTHPSLDVRGKGGREFAGLFAVNYTMEKISGVPSPNNVLDTLLTKSLEWAYEKEWRFVRTLSLLRHVGSDVYVSDVPPEAIKRIIIGARFPAEKLGEITKHTQDGDLKHVVVQQAMMSPHRFGLKLVDPIKYGWASLHRKHHFGEASEEALLCIPMEDDK